MTLADVKIPLSNEKNSPVQIKRGKKLLLMTWQIRRILKIAVEGWKNVFSKMEETTFIPGEKRVKIDENIALFRYPTPGQYPPVVYSA